MTRSAGSWDKAISSVTQLLGAGAEVAVVIVLCEANIDDLPNFSSTVTT